jgi:site-specific DNA recombinase
MVGEPGETLPHEPRLRGLRVYRGEIHGDANWPAILDRQTFDAIAARFEPRRGGRGGQDVMHLLSGVARCGKCGEPMHVWTGPRGQGTYACTSSGGHLTRNQKHLDAYITAILLERLAAVDFGDLTAEHPETAAAPADAAKLRQRLDDAAAEYSAGNVTAIMLGKVEKELVPQIKAAEKRARAAAIHPNIGELAGAGVDERWDALTVEQRREVMRVLVDITVLPSTLPRGASGFDPDAVRIEWRTWIDRKAPAAVASRRARSERHHHGRGHREAFREGRVRAGQRVRPEGFEPPDPQIRSRRR